MEKNQIINRLKIAEGQIRGIQNMILEQRNWKDTLQQIAAVESAINNVAILLLENHTESSIENIVENGGENKEIQKLLKTISGFIRK